MSRFEIKLQQGADQMTVQQLETNWKSIGKVIYQPGGTSDFCWDAKSPQAGYKKVRDSNRKQNTTGSQ